MQRGKSTCAFGHGYQQCRLRGRGKSITRAESPGGGRADGTRCGFLSDRAAGGDGARLGDDAHGPRGGRGGKKPSVFSPAAPRRARSRCLRELALSSVSATVGGAETGAPVA